MKVFPFVETAPPGLGPFVNAAGIDSDRKLRAERRGDDECDVARIIEVDVSFTPQFDLVT